MSVHEELYARACTVLPAGVNSPVRAFKSVGGTPLYVSRAAGAHLYGEGGEAWIDFCRAWGPLILGHADPEVVEAVTRAAQDGLAFGTVTRGEIELAEAILAGYPGRDRVRLVCSGTEAVLTALRLARGATGRDMILKFGGCYHGHVDAMMVNAGSGLVSFGTGDSAGVVEGAHTVVAPLDDEAAIDQAFARYGDRIAAAIVEPVPANNGLLPQRPEWHRHLRAATTRAGALLIHDEVITGFRFGYHGYEALLDVRPDLTTLGKIVGGGLPLAAVVGPAALMDKLSPAGPVYQAGTMAGNPVAVAAGRATLAILKRGDVYRHLAALGEHFDRIAPLAGATDTSGDVSAVRWVRQGPIVWPWLAAGAPPRADGAIPASVRPIYGRLFRAWLDAGLYTAPSAFEVGFLCAAHTTEHLDRLVQVARALPV